jgi:hypothetical protein
VTAINQFDKPVELAQIAAGCPCARIDPASLLIDRRGSATISLMLDLRSANSAQGAIGSFRSFSLPVSCHVNAAPERSNVVFVVTGNVRDPLRCAEPRVSFGEDDFLPDGRWQTRRDRLEMAIPCEKLVVSAAPPQVLTAKVTQLSRTTAMLELTPAPDLPGDSFACAVRIEATAVGGDLLPAVTLPVGGTVIHDLGFSPRVVSFGTVAAGGSPEATVVLTSRTGRSIVVESVVSPSDETIVDAVRTASVPPNTYRVRQRVAKIGPQSQTVRFTVSCGGAHQLLDLPVSFVGISN